MHILIGQNKKRATLSIVFCSLVFALLVGCRDKYESPRASDTMDLVAELSNDDEATRTRARKSLEVLGTDATPELIAAIESNDQDLQLQAIGSLRILGEKAGGVTPSLVKLLKSDDAELREHAMKGIALIGPAAQSASPAVAELLDATESAEEAKLATATLATIEAPAEVAVPILIKTFSREIVDELLIAGAVHSFGKDAVPYLREGMFDENDAVRRGCVLTLGVLKLDASDAAGELMTTLEEDKDPLVRARSALALAMVAPKHPDVLQALSSAMIEANEEVRQAAARAMRTRLSQLEEEKEN